MDYPNPFVSAQAGMWLKYVHDVPGCDSLICMLDGEYIQISTIACSSSADST